MNFLNNERQIKPLAVWKDSVQLMINVLALETMVYDFTTGVLVIRWKLISCKEQASVSGQSYGYNPIQGAIPNESVQERILVAEGEITVPTNRVKEQAFDNETTCFSYISQVLQVELL